MKRFLTLLVSLVATLVGYSAPTYTSYFNNTHTYTNSTTVGTNFAGRGVFTNGITAGASTFTGVIAGVDGAVGATMYGNAAGTSGLYFVSGSPLISRAGVLSLSVESTGVHTYTPLNIGASGSKSVLVSEAANTLALRNAANAQTFRVYETYTDASNYRRGSLTMSSGTLNLVPEGAGTGGSVFNTVIASGAGAGSALYFQTAANLRWRIDGNGHILAQTDNTYDIGAVNATRPRNGFFGGDVTVNLTVGTAVTLSSTNHFYLCNVDAQTVTLPTAVGIKGKEYEIKLISPATTGTVATTSSQLIDGAASYSLSASNKFVRVVSDGTNWWNFGSN